MARLRSPAAIILLTTCTLLVGSVWLIKLLFRMISVYTRPARHIAESTPADVGLPYETVHLMTEDWLRIVAWYIPPRNGAVIIGLHGIWGNRGQLLGITSDLAARGFGLLLLDLR